MLILFMLYLYLCFNLVSLYKSYIIFGTVSSSTKQIQKVDEITLDLTPAFSFLIEKKNDSNASSLDLQVLSFL